MTFSLDDLKISPEVAAYLEARGIPFPECAPKIKTPEPRDIDGALFSFERVDRVIRAFSMLNHVSGQWAGRPLNPDPWQVAYILAPVFGWVKWDEDSESYVRIIRTLYVDVPRKNGKSTLLGGIAIYMMAADGEPGAQVVAAATSVSQARFVFDPIRLLSQKSPALSRNVKTVSRRVTHPKSGSYCEVVSSAANAQHGANLHCGVIDELHVHDKPDLVETIETGTGSRRQPLIAMITTADSGKRNTIYARKRDYVEQLARGAFVDPSFFGVVFAADESDDPFVEETWRKANPGYGVSPTRSYLASKAAQAQQSPADLSVYQRLHLGLRTKQETRYFNLDAYDRNQVDLDESAFVGKVAYGGLDLASTSDLCALCWIFPDNSGGFDAIWRLWTPEENLEALDRRTAGMASVWARDGLIELTPGNVADYDYIRRQIKLDREKFDVRGLAYDPYNSSQLVNELMADGAPMVKTRQGKGTLSAPTKELQKLILQGTRDKPMFRHGDNAAVRWQFDNVAIAMDAAGNVQPDKGNSADKIDAVSATVDALSLVLVAEPVKRSKYIDGDLVVI